MYNYFMDLIIGKDEYLSEIEIDKLLNNNYKNYLPSKYSYDFNINIFLDDILQRDLFNDKKVFIVKDWNILESSEMKKSDFDNISLHLRLTNYPIIFVVNKNIKKQNQLLKYIFQNSNIIEIPELQNYEIADFIRKYISDKNYNFDYKAVSHLLDVLPDDLKIITQEIEKLSMLAKEITIDDIDESISFYDKEIDYQLLDAIASNKPSVILKVFHETIESGVDPILIMGQLASLFILASEVHNLMEIGNSVFTINEKLGVHQYRIKKAKEIVDLMGISKIRFLIDRLEKTDYRIKKKYLDPIFSLEVFILNLVSQEIDNE
ncbi:DNA polymerase III delta subunit [Mycoplasma testudineum]|uniref:DNA polymerase III subunit delta n=2 Tax=Mycoplasma testudineum TaxID=244584 RepID=A0A4V3C387_9MOLU|nr:DNA polymerase III subunit delta [Mycoplasma testudineum]TDO21109.1 DNA polymerase III delta subunit [Mycoplasma testudineum]